MLNNYAKWRKIDLHIHSEASIGDSNLTVNRIIEEAIENSIELIALTDHSNVDNIDEFISKAKSEDLSVLPGVELKTEMGRPPVHIISIFPEGIDQQTLSEDFLHPLGVTRSNIIKRGMDSIGDGHEEPEYFERGLYEITVSFKDAANITRKLGGIIVAHAGKKTGSFEQIPHATSNATLYEVWNSLSAEKSNLMENYIDVCELYKYDERQIEFYLNTFLKPTILCSDAHQKGQIGTNSCWVKMDTVDFNGLKQIIYEPDIRVAYKNEDVSTKHFYIKRIESDNGYFRNIDMQMSPDLNTIIGGNSTGKSVIVDYLRFVVNNYPQDKVVSDFHSRLHGLLREGSVVKASIMRGGNEIGYFERKLSMEKRSVEDTPNDISEIPSIAEYDIDMHNFKIEAYSQGELKDIIKHRTQLLKVFDGLGDYKFLLSFRSELADALEANRENLQKYYKDIKIHSEKLQHQKDLISKINETKIKIDDPIVVEFQKWQYEKTVFDNFDTSLKKATKLLRAMSEEMADLLKFDIDVEKVKSTGLIDELISKNEIIRGSIKEHESIYNTKLSAFREDVDRLKEEHLWMSEYPQKEAEYKRYTLEKGIQNINIDLDNIQKWESEIIDIEKLNQPKFKSIINKIDTLFFDRKCLIYELHELNEELSKKRQDNATQLNERYDDIQFRIESLDLNYFHSYCKAKCKGLGIKKFDQQLNEFQKYEVMPTELIEFVNKSDIKGLASKCGITENTSSIIIGCFLEYLPGIDHNLSNAFLELQEIAVEPSIKLSIVEKNGTSTNFENLSPGKQCSFLLSILFSSSNYPLIIDQPEDQLDSEYIEAISDSLRRNKGKRQFIIVTHNQNITVLADSEKVIKVAKDETETAINQGEVLITGAVEREAVRDGILSLEGGSEAFKKRAKKYGLTYL